MDAVTTPAPVTAAPAAVGAAPTAPATAPPVAAAMPIRRTLMRMVLLSSGAVLVVTTPAFCAYEFLTFRQASIQQLRDLEPGDRQQQHRRAGVRQCRRTPPRCWRHSRPIRISSRRRCTTRTGKLFATYPRRTAAAALAGPAGGTGYASGARRLRGFQPVVEGSKHARHAVRRVGPGRDVCARCACTR